ncbi:hypothetical protein NKH77_32860 [Streptomyces sp. M19]
MSTSHAAYLTVTVLGIRVGDTLDQDRRTPLRPQDTAHINREPP